MRSRLVVFAPAPGLFFLCLCGMMKKACVDAVKLIYRDWLTKASKSFMIRHRTSAMPVNPAKGGEDEKTKQEFTAIFLEL